VRKIKNLFFDKFPSIMLFVLIDLFVAIAASLLSIWVVFDFGNIPEPYLNGALNFIPFDFFVLLAFFVVLRLYTSVWQYASVLELVNIILGCTFTELFSSVFKHLLGQKMPKSYYLLQIFLLIALTCASRFSFRFIRMLKIRFEGDKNAASTMLIGAGDAGKMILDEVYNSGSRFNARITCVVDDRKSKVGSYLRGHKIEGTTKDIERLAEKHQIKNIIIAIPSASKERIARIVTECHKTKANIEILPSIYATMSEHTPSLLSQVRPLSYEDFLGRDQIVVDNAEINAHLWDKTILVTGGGGSIGSELCRQIAKAAPKLLIIFDIYENNAYEIEQELLRKYPDLNLKTIIGSVRDYPRLEKVFAEFHPEQVYHAAAHKHVPLMEVSPNEAIKNNCLGTLNTAKLAAKYGAKKFVLVSTDKAVRPTNIMGASKRICEMIVQAYDKLSKNTDFVAVRFGNVLGSNGSVIPLFLKQIDSGSPVTVTHKDITRYFMTIPEAVSLILQASVYAEGGEIFVLDMGEPVKIYELAKKIIRYRGLEPGKDIEIKITGLRPGEKLYEEMLMEEEGLKETPNKLIHIGKPLHISPDFLEKLDDLISAAKKNSDDIKPLTARLVTTYKLPKEKN